MRLRDILDLKRSQQLLRVVIDSKFLALKNYDCNRATSGGATNSILLTIIEDGVAQGIFLNPPVLDVQLAINSIIGTINWSLYDLLVVKNENLEPEAFAK